MFCYPSNCRKRLTSKRIDYADRFTRGWGSSHGEVAHMLDHNIVVSEFELLSRYHNHFRTNTLGKGMLSLIPTSYVLNGTTNILLQIWLWNEMKHIPLNKNKPLNKETKPNQTKFY